MRSSDSKSSPVPRYFRVRQSIENDIREGRLKPGDMLPSESSLCEIHQVSSITIRRALRDLVDAGLIYRENGVGTFVADQKRRFSNALIFSGFTEQGWREQSDMFGAMIGGAGKVVWEHDSSLSVINLASEKALVEAIQQIAENNTFDGVMIRPRHDPSDEAVAALIGSRLPHVMIKRNGQHQELNAVLINNHEYARIATEHLLSIGHHRICCIVGESSSSTFRARADGFVAAMRDHSAAIEPNHLIFAESEFAPSGYAAAMTLFNSPNRPTALVIGSDHLTQGVYLALKELQLDVPGQVALVGFDELGAADRYQPPLTALSTTDYDLGIESAKLLIALLQGEKSAPVRVNLDAEIIVRATSIQSTVVP